MRVKEISSFKFTKQTKSRLSKFARRKSVTMTAVLEALIERYCVTHKEEK